MLHSITAYPHAKPFMCCLGECSVSNWGQILPPFSARYISVDHCQIHCVEQGSSSMQCCHYGSQQQCWKACPHGCHVTLHADIHQYLPACAVTGSPCSVRIWSPGLLPERVWHGWWYQTLCQSRCGSCEDGLCVIIELPWPKLPASATSAAVARQASCHPFNEPGSVGIHLQGD